MRLLLLRHAESKNNSLKLVLPDAEYFEARLADPGLSDEGITDTLKFTEMLKTSGIKIDKIFTSAFRRSLQTVHHLRS